MIPSFSRNRATTTTPSETQSPSRGAGRGFPGGIQVLPHRIVVPGSVARDLRGLSSPDGKAFSDPRRSQGVWDSDQASNMIPDSGDIRRAVLCGLYTIPTGAGRIRSAVINAASVA